MMQKTPCAAHTSMIACISTASYIWAVVFTGFARTSARVPGMSWRWCFTSAAESFIPRSSAPAPGRHGTGVAPETAIIWWKTSHAEASTRTTSPGPDTTASTADNAARLPGDTSTSSPVRTWRICSHSTTASRSGGSPGPLR
jgi:hypothetical protein